MNAIITTIKKGTLVLPKDAYATFGDGDVMVVSTSDGLYVKKVQTSGRVFSETAVATLKRAGKRITTKEIATAVRTARARKK